MHFISYIHVHIYTQSRIILVTKNQHLWWLLCTRSCVNEKQKETRTCKCEWGAKVLLAFYITLCLYHFVFLFYRVFLTPSLPLYVVFIPLATYWNVYMQSLPLEFSFCLCKNSYELCVCATLTFSLYSNIIQKGVFCERENYEVCERERKTRAYTQTHDEHTHTRLSIKACSYLNNV